jgi:outer membrane lipoprotein-sorting protein
MKYVINHFSVILLGMSAFVLLCSGCQQGSATDPSQAAKKQVSPEESFEEIASQFARSMQTGVGGVDSGFIVRQEGGHSRLAIRNEVTSELIPPSKEGEPYRGVITVTSQRDYSIQRAARGDSPDDESVEKEEDARRNQSSDGQGVNILDNDLVKAPPDERRSDSGSSEGMVARLSDEDVSNYELEYENNRWVLKTKLDPDTELSIENAFNHVLSLQP